MSDLILPREPIRPRARAWGRLIRAHRKQLKLTQVQLAEMMSVSQGVISHWERGVKLPSPSNQSLLAEVLGIPDDDLARLVRQVQ